MSLIITATDYSAIGNHAVRYACKLATDYNADIEIVHSYSFPVIFSDVPVPAELIEETQNDADEKMQQLVALLTVEYPGIKISGKVAYGDLENTVETGNKNPWLLVVGDDTTGNESLWAENPLSDILHAHKCPVLAIPPDAEYKPLNKICLAFDNKHAGNDMAMVQLRELTLKLAASLDVVHARTDVMVRENIPVIDENVVNLLADASPRYHIFYNVVVDDAINKFAAENDIDVLAIIPRQYSFFEGLFHKSHTRSLTRTAHIPIMALHENKQK